MTELEQNVITREGLKELKAELKNLVEVERPKVIQEIKEAREQGDLSENAEFDAARDLQGQIEDRIQEIEKIIDSSKVISTGGNATKVRLGSTVTIKINKTGKSETYQIVGTLEADPFEDKISNMSPLGEVLMGKEVKDKVKVDASPSYEITIMKIN